MAMMVMAGLHRAVPVEVNYLVGRAALPLLAARWGLFFVLYPPKAANSLKRIDALTVTDEIFLGCFDP